MMMDEDHNVLAAEYVLGTLDPEERQRAEALMRRDANFATLVRDWEQRLGELNATVPAIEPPPEIFERIKQRLPRVSAACVPDWSAWPVAQYFDRPRHSPWED